jgi:hypothetical protein
MEKVTGVALGLRLAAAFMVAATFSTYSMAKEPTVTRIVIDDDWGGLNPTSPHRSHWVIEPQGTGYVISGEKSQRRMATQANGSWTEERDVTNIAAQPVSGAAVDALVRALRAPSQDTIDPSVFGTDIDHAGRTIDEMVRKLTALNPPPALRQRILAWGNSLRQGHLLAQAITVGVTTSFHTDDSPRTRVEADFADGSTLAFSSGSQNLLLLPWSDASGRKSYSTAIPKALAAVLPPTSTNRKRLAREPSEDELDDYLEKGMGNDYARFQVQIVAPQAYAALASRFTVVEINPLDTSSDPLFVTVSLPGGPSNLILGTQLDIEGHALAKPSDLDGMMAALNTAATATGLHQAMLAAPKDDFRIEHGVDMQSFQAGAKKQFIEQMAAAHKLPELAKHPQLLDGAVLVTQGDDPTYWVALHDRRAVAWKRYVGNTSTPGHPLCSNVPAPDESFGSQGNSDECVGKVYDAAGKAL